MAKNIKLDMKDIRAFEKKLKSETSKSKNSLKIGLLKAVTLVHRESVNNTREGVKYVDGVHDKGNLRRALTFDIISNTMGKVFISKGLDYPTFVEFGTRRMRPKPFLSLAVRDNINNIRDIFKEAVNKTLLSLTKLK